MTTDVALKPTIARLRAKNQLTLPDAIVRAVGAEKGDRFHVVVQDGGIRLEPIRKSYAGSLKGMWPPDWIDELRQERDSWERRESS